MVVAAQRSTEDNIIDSVLNEGDSGGTEDTTVQDQGTGAAGDAAGAGQGAAGTRQGTQQDKTGKQPAGQQAQQGQQQQTQQQQQQQRAAASSPGDLKDRNGNVLARAGAERRIFEKADQHIRAEYQNFINELQTKVDTYERANSMGSQLGLSPGEVTTGHQLMAAYKKNPVETIKFLLTQAQANGHNVQSLGVGTDVAAISRIIDERLAPLTADREAAAQQQQQVAEIEDAYGAFIGHYPDAQVHEHDIAALLNEDHSVTPEVAYLKLQSFAYRNGLDWSKPLAPQIQARMAQQGGQQQQQQQRGLPQGRPGGGAQRMDGAGVAHESTPTRDIVRSAMRSAGYRF